MVRSERFSARRCRTKERSSGPTPARSERTPVGIWRPRRRTGPLGRRFLAKSFSQAADLGFWIAAVTPEGLQEGQLAFLGPAGHGLGRDMQDVGHLGGPEVAGRGGCGLAGGLGCHGASLSCGGLRLRCHAWCWNEQDDYRDRTKHSTIARLGRFRTQLPSATDGDLTPDAAAAQRMCRLTSSRTPPRSRFSAAPLSPSEDAGVPGAVGVLLVLGLAGLVLIVAAGLVPAAVAVLMGFAIPLVGSVQRLGALLAGGLVAIGSIPGTSRPGCWRVATRRAHGQHRSTCPSRRRHRRTGLGFLYH